VAEIADTFNAGITEIAEGLFIVDRAIWFATFVRRPLGLHDLRDLCVETLTISGVIPLSTAAAPRH
jgi:hypothetical protein